MARVLISGYYGFDNAGDDAVLYGIISSLKRHLDRVEISVLSNKPDETRKRFGIPAYNRWKPTEIITRVKHCDLLVMGGGSLLQDATSPRSVIYYLGIVTIAKMLTKPVIFYAQGVGPISHPLSKKLIRLIVNRVDVITVRDEQSGQDLKDLGVTQAPIHVTADPAITINPEEIGPERGQRILDQYTPADSASPKMAISVRKWKNETRYRRELARLADDMIDQGWNIYLIPMQYPADIAESREIIKHMNHRDKPHRVFLLDQKMDFRDIISVIENMDFVLGMRLHSVILSAVTGVPFVALSYDPKVERFVERIGMTSAGNIRDLSYQQLSERVQQSLQDLPGLQHKLNQNMSNLIREAERGSILARDLLKS
ncbi:MAG: polysaccharide pyruvyl transferase CsaB [Bacillaceae bacterium]|nr:polysaccharide pyruvyl transferase CsaB [Bacillaceae bacterium]